MADKPASETATPAPAAAVEDNKDGFGAAFAERANDPQRDEVAETQQDDAGPASSENEAAAAASTEATADKAGAEGTGSGTEAKAEQPAAIDPFAGMTPEQRSYWQRIGASEKSNRGRVSALQRKLREGTATKATPAKAAEPKDQTGTGQQTSEGTSEATTQAADLDKRLQTARDEYGEIVGPVADLLDEVRKEIASMKGTVSQVEEAVDEAELADAYEALGDVHPDYAELAADANFNAWLSDQPQKVIELANSFDPREVSLSLTLFKTERAAALATQTGQSSEAEGEGQQAATEAQGQQESTATDTKRQRQLEGSKAVPAKGAPAAAGTPNDFGSAFKARARANAG